MPNSAHDDRDRKNIHVSVCSNGYDGWLKFSIQHGCTVTALLDAFGHQLAELALRKETCLKPGALEDSVVLARTIDAERRAR